MTDPSIVRLSEDCKMDIMEFDCSGDWIPKNEQEQIIKDGEIEINLFLQNESLSQQKLGVSTTYLFYDENKIASFVTILSDSIKLSNKEKLNAELPYKDAPAIKIGRIGCDYRLKGRGFGNYAIEFVKALAYNLTKGKDVSGEDILVSLGVRYVTLDSYENNLQYYERQGFVRNNAEIYRERLNISMRYDLF